MQQTERDLLIQIDTKLDMYRKNLDEHIVHDEKHFNDLYSRVRTVESIGYKVVGGAAVINLILLLIMKFWG